MSKEGETGKIYVSGLDRQGRPIVVFDNSVQNTNDVSANIVYLSWNLEHAIEHFMTGHVDQYLIFIHLENWSWFNMPPMSSSMETIHMLCSCYPERLGCCVAYQPPFIFKGFFDTVKGFLDPKTVNKIVFLSGDVSTGSENDIRMRDLIGADWKRLTGADMPVLKEGCSPGYDHATFWPKVLERYTTKSTGRLQLIFIEFALLLFLKLQIIRK